MGRGNLLEWFIYCLPSRALKGRHTHPLLSVCVWKTAWVMHYSWNLGMPPKTPSQLKRLLLWFAVCWVNARKLGKREQEGCHSVSFRDVSEWLSFLPPGNFYFRVKEAPLLTKLRKIRAYSRQYLVTWQTPRADPFVREERVALAHGFTPCSFGPVAFASWGSLSWWGVFGRRRWHWMTPRIHSSWVCVGSQIETRTIDCLKCLIIPHLSEDHGSQW